MAYAIKVDAPGGPETLKISQVPDIKPKADEVRIRHTAIGVNYIDVYHRSGLYKLNMPFVPGVEAAGVIEEVGSDVTWFKPGDRAVYGTATHIPGAYSTHRTMPAQYLVRTPDDISDEVAASMMLKGMTAHYLIHRTFAAKEDIFILVHAAAGGVGTYICQWASELGCKVIGTVGSTEKMLWAAENGCHYPINYKTEDFVAKTMEITGGKGVPVVYDSVGKGTFAKSLDCLMPLGLLVSYGQSSGPIPPFDLGLLAKRSTFVTRPVISHYKSDRNEFILSASELFQCIRSGFLKPRITHRIPLKDAAEAHRLLESRQTMGSIILIP